MTLHTTANRQPVGNLKAEIILPFGFEDYLFALKAKEIEELEYQCGKIGFGALYQRVMMGTWALDDLSHIIRLGLIGGGMAHVKATELATRHCVPPYSGQGRPETVARSILAATMVGFEDIANDAKKPTKDPDKDKAPGKHKRPIPA